MKGVNILHISASLLFLFLVFSMKRTCHGREISSSYHPNGLRHFANRFNSYANAWDKVRYEGHNCGVIPKVKVKYRSREPGVSTFGQVPWQAGVFDKKTNNLICSGALVSADFVITSAVCMLPVESSDELVIRLGDWDISSQESLGETYEHMSSSISDVLLHPDGPIGESVPVLSLLKLQNPVDFASYPHISPICIPPLDFTFMENKHSFDSCFVSGWGTWTNADVHKSSSERLETSYETKDIPELVVSFKVPITTYPNLSDHEEPIRNYEFGSTAKEKVPYDILSIDDNEGSGSRESKRKPIANSGIKLPDPLDYAESEEETLTPWSKNDDALSSVSGLSNVIRPYQNIDGALLNSPQFLDITDSYETSIHHSRRKYKIAKSRGNVKPDTKKPQNEQPFESTVVVDNPFSHDDNKNSLSKQRFRRLYQSHAEPERKSQLKLFKVVAYGNCHYDTRDPDFVQSSTKYCVSPTSGAYLKFSCMVDLGSPVFCTSPDPRKVDRVRRIKRFRPFTYVEPTRAYLVGFVSNQNPRCFNSDLDDFHSDYLNQAQFTPFDKGTVRFVHENI